MTVHVWTRRPVKTRSLDCMARVSRWLCDAGVHPNHISLGSIAAASAAAACLLAGYPVIAALFIQLRLLCNLLDGMVAIEGGRQTKSGEIFNDFPDRIADALIFIGAGYGARQHLFGVELGFIAAALAIFTAYVRMLGGASGLEQSFIGPMAKQHRMFTLTLGCLLSIFETRFFTAGSMLWVVLMVINLGCLITIWRRTAHIARELESR